MVIIGGRPRSAKAPQISTGKLTTLTIASYITNYNIARYSERCYVNQWDENHLSYHLSEKNKYIGYII